MSITSWIRPCTTALSAAALAALATGCPPPGPVCGDAVCDLGELGCLADCGGCGDGVAVGGEECDPPDGTTCDLDCTLLAYCGDGTVDPGETCDPPGAGTCDELCQEIVPDPICGDGTLDPGETCDDGAANSDTVPDACRTDCTPPSCGDAVADTGEECDPPDGAACAADCTVAPSCGDGTVDPGEECEPPGTAACSAACQVIACGDGVVDPPEECEPPNSVDCTAVCQLGSTCGNGVLDAGETCDPPNGTTCLAGCQLACGNGVINVGEACDPPGSGCGLSGTCSTNCGTCVPPAPPNPGAACTTDDDCSAGTTGLADACLDEATDQFPGGFCYITGCTPDGMGGDDCPDTPVPSACVLVDAVTYACLPTCTPSAAGIGGCRTSTTADFSYACYPDIVSPDTGFCFLGCQTDVACSRCDTASGTCERDPGAACAADVDCTGTPFAWSCNGTVNLCHPDHAPGGSSVGDPCTDDLDCPATSYCETSPTAYPGGYCTIAYCDSLAAIPAFSCPAGSVCPATAGFSGGLLQLCAAACTVSPFGDNTAACDVARGDAFDYVCIETTTASFGYSEYCDAAAAGFCFQWTALFGSGTGITCQ